MKKITHIFTGVLLVLLTISANAQSFEWAKAFGGSNIEKSSSVVVDAQGNVYTVGYFEGTVDFDPGAGTYNLTSNGYIDAFIQKLDASGNLVWAKSFGGASNDFANSVTVDSFGNVYTVGRFRGIVDFDSGAGTYNLTSNGYYDVFIQKLDTLGNLVWAKSFGGTYRDGANSVTVDAQGNVYAVGYFEGTADFDPGAGIYNLTSNGGNDAFIQKLDALGNLVWAKAFGGIVSDQANSVAVDAQGNVYTSGIFQRTVDFDPGASSHNLTSLSYSTDCFIQKLDALGNFVWAKSFGGTHSDEANSVTVDAQGNVYTVGRFQRTVDFDPGAGTYNLATNGGGMVLLYKN